MIYKWGGDFIEGNFPRGWKFSQGAIFSGENFWGEIFTGGDFHFIGGNIHRGVFSLGAIFWGRGNFPDTVNSM